ncbi:MAG: citrate synthase [Actinobacteria bacterium]|nr:citrate synthase [Actinomycetota bacterium]MCB9389213.1 citrate synthase [Acidimicrobiia bacterium]
MDMTGTARFVADVADVEMPIVEGTEHELGIDIAKLRSSTGVVTLDPGFVNTASCESAITFLNGEEGVLRYRGYPIEQLAQSGSFLETCYLLIWGELPNVEQLDDFRNLVRRHTLLHEDMKGFFRAFPHNAHPMAILSSVVSALSTFYQDSYDPDDPEQVEIQIIRLLAKLPTIAAFSYKKSIGQPFVYPSNSLDLIQNFLTMMFAVPSEPYEARPVVVRALKQLLILHADHEQNCSTSTVRIVGSSKANLFASVAAGINALWGPLHGGANQAVIEMLERIRDDGGDVSRYVAKAKDRDDPFRLMGFGHRVYKSYDPRARIIKATAHQVFEDLGFHDDLLDIALQLEAVALGDEFFIERKLYPNVDFYSGLIYRAMGFPTKMFTVLFALGRLPGWIAHWKEMNEDPGTKIGRPRQIYIGHTERPYVPRGER